MNRNMLRVCVHTTRCMSRVRMSTWIEMSCHLLEKVDVTTTRYSRVIRSRPSISLQLSSANGMKTDVLPSVEESRRYSGRNYFFHLHIALHMLEHE